MPDLSQQLQQCLKGRVCLMGLGNVDYGDDGFGVLLAAKLTAAGLPDVVVAEANPERFLGRITAEGFDHVVFLDAVEFGGTAGSVIFLNTAEMVARFPQISTHKISLGVLARWVEANGMTKAWLLGVQPESIRPGSQLTPTLRTTLEVLYGFFLSLWSPQAATGDDGKTVVATIA